MDDKIAPIECDGTNCSAPLHSTCCISGEKKPVVQLDAVDQTIPKGRFFPDEVDLN